MKLVFSLFLIFLFLNADEIQRLDSIVKDIENLRINYDLSQEQLKKCQVELSDEQQKNALMRKELQSSNSDNNTEIQIEKKYRKKIHSLKNQIKSLNNLVKEKENEISRLKKRYSKITKNQIKVKCNLDNKTNVFPNLIMREQKEKEVGAATYRLTQESVIYSDVNGKEIDKWEKSTSFTSTLRLGNWIKISGYFVDKKWQKAQRQMWVEASHAFKRD